MGSLLIIQSGFLGDAVLASGLLRALSASGQPPAVGLVVRAEFAELFQGHPGLTDLHPFDKKRKGGAADLAAELRSHRYDTALVPHRSFRSAILARNAGISRRIGFRQSAAPFLLTERIDYNIALHETERNAMLLRGVEQVPSGSIGSWLIPTTAAISSMRGRFPEGEPIVTIAPGSVWPTKRWGLEGFATVAATLAREGFRVALAGSRGERDLCLRIAERAGEGGWRGSIDVVAGELSLSEMLALIAISARVVSNDSAPLHLAESVGTPVTAIFGPTVPEFGFGPRGEGSNVAQIQGLECRPCRIHGSPSCPIGTHECMNLIAPEDVLAAVRG
jgi:heptosyltransferase-2